MVYPCLEVRGLIYHGGDMGLLGHLWKMLSFRSADIIVIAHQPIVDKLIEKII